MRQVKKNLVRAVRSVLWKFGVGIASSSALQAVVEKAEAFDIWNPVRDYELLSNLKRDQVMQYLGVVKRSKSQLRQDLFVLSQLGFKREGFFVEFGATNGIDLSNTYLLEREFGWRGILAEPARRWHHRLTRNRSAIVDKRCVWASSGEKLRFNEVDVGELSTIDSFSAADSHAETRRKGKVYEVETVSLNDLLDQHGAPPRVDYLSIDTEGSEFEILKSFDFERRSFSVITCEHNYTPLRDEIHALLTQNGYVRKFQELSEFDDWYVKVD